MTCFNPLQAWQSKDGVHPSGKPRLVFSECNGLPNTEMLVPCGQCIGCRLERSRQWAIRCVHEAKMHDNNCFITLTYDNEHLPENKSLIKRDLQLFLKRLRKKYGEGIRFYACGEYGEEGERPHYHACVFNHDFEDKELWTVRQGIPLYRSKELEKIWPFGFATIGDVTFESAAYVARYIMKKITGEEAENHYGQRIPEFTNMSRRPGIGRPFVEEYSRDIYAIDAIILRNGLKMHPPKYYDSIYDQINPSKLKEIKEVRKCKHNKFDDQEYRIKCKARIKQRQIKKLKRGFENV